MMDSRFAITTAELSLARVDARRTPAQPAIRNPRSAI